ncbi:HlyD family efflux transporter periplasmic adaptor subunit [Salinisphaera sp. G21_0]|uniref:HlyD family efflux transporter periplasmic adaptor subunit n=1 Tax=Salinisphaera sp. G21_0 TaxID=2821094 RepID=UPI001ADBAE80|nr:HlyD family efflux transporter periplasmic adaptor subunit [Salinisphaera sp. G21_0]MBO9479979.1 HlyD family efflux transporter periplasmic adaptor subunit [Salinisphaera sp. G21_0]
MGDFPALREELQLLPGEQDARGAPGWFIFDPIRNQYFRIEQEALLILHYWREGSLSERMDKEKGAVDQNAVENVKTFLLENQLLKVTTADDLSRLICRQKKEQEGRKFQLIFSYLFYRIPLINPDAFLEQLMPLFKKAIHVRWGYLIGLLGVVGFYLSFRQWDAFVNSTTSLMSPGGVIYFLIALVLTKVVHEFGHGLVAKYYGCRIPTMGIALIVFFPILYTDTTDSWRLGSYRKRMMIGVAGIVAEMIIACLAVFIWPFLPDGNVKNAVFMLAAVTWISSLLINLNPLMRFDGYYLLSDGWRIENLQSRAFALARWQLREWIFKLSHPMPELWNRKQKRKLLVYAYGTWIYRLLLLTGIALLVYQLFFKLAGMILLVATIGWFIVRPVASEASYLWSIRQSIQWGRNLMMKTAVLSLLCLMLFLPINTTLRLPAVLVATDAVEVFPPQAGGVIENVFVKEGEPVKQGQLLFRLKNSDLLYQLQQLDIQLDLLDTLLNRMASTVEYTQSYPVFLQRRRALIKAQSGLKKQQALLDIKAPVDGIVVYLDNLLTHGQWVNPESKLLQLRSESGFIIDAYIAPGDLGRIAKGDMGRFYPDDITASPVAASVMDISPVASRVMETEYLSADYGGAIEVIRDEQGRAMPREGVYRVRFNAQQSGLAVEQVSVGTVRVDVDGRSLSGYLWDQLWGVVVRESGF